MELDSKYKAFNSWKNAVETVTCEMVTIMPWGDEFMSTGVSSEGAKKYRICHCFKSWYAAPIARESPVN